MFDGTEEGVVVLPVWYDFGGDDGGGGDDERWCFLWWWWLHYWQWVMTHDEW